MCPASRHGQRLALLRDTREAALVRALATATRKRHSASERRHRARFANRGCYCAVLERIAGRAIKNRIAIITLPLALLPSLALAEPLPLPKPAGPGGSCPHGWLASGSFCVPSQGAQDAIARPPNGTCPWGWTSSGSYCLHSGGAR